MPSSKSAIGEFDELEDKGTDTCLTCPKLCRWACPVAEIESRESTTPQSLVVLGSLLKRERASVESVGTFPYHCSHCGSCTEACQHNNDVPFLISLTRSRLMKSGAALSSVVELCGHFGVAGNPQGTSLAGTLEDVASEAGTTIRRTADRVYFPGCETLSGAKDVAVAFLRTTSLFGLPEVSLTPASAACCGLPLLWAGELEGFRAHAARNAEQLRDVKTLIVHDPGCAHAMASRYKDFGITFSPEVKHVSQFLAEELQLEGDVAESPLSRQANAFEGQKIAYFDSCALARGLGVTQEPRTILRSLLGRRPVELPGLKEREVDCCGAAGLLPLTVPDTAFALARARLDAFAETGADTLATFCPRCAAHLRSVDPSLSIVDVTTLLARL